MPTSIDTPSTLPSFSTIPLESIEANLKQLLQDNRERVDALLHQKEAVTWNNLMQPLEDLNDRLNQFWAPISHLNAVAHSETLRTIYHRCLPLLSEYNTELSHNHRLFTAIQSIADGLEYQKLNPAQRKVIDNELRDFRLAGVTLPAEEKGQLAQLFKALSELSTRFEDNVLDATQGWTKLIQDKAVLTGLPEHTIAHAKQAAEGRHEKGWLLTLEAPVYMAVMVYAESRTLREEMYRAFNTRASDQGPHAGRWDNSDIMQKILTHRDHIARLLKFKQYADYSLAMKMVQTPEQAIDFLNQLAQATLPKAREEFKELTEFARNTLGIDELKAWDIAWASEKLRLQRYAISQEDLRPYFPEPQVIEGLFSIVHRLFRIRMVSVQAFDRWHPSVRCYAVYDEQNELRSFFYFDLYARENKRGGAWMDDHRVRRRLSNGELQIPIALITCNFNPPVGKDPALFNHEEVITLFHEFGHALQHMLTRIDYAPVSGIHGIPWDAVELASQFLENWAWEKESLDLLAKHYKTEQPLPEALFQKMHQAKNFQSALKMMRQLEFALFDMRLHQEFDPQQSGQIQHILDAVRTMVCVVPVPDFNRFQHGFSHIFAGGYAAGYYSYKWAEVMASDAFSLFQEKGVFDPETAQHFLMFLLEPGGSEDPAELFKAFRGREPRVEALLIQAGIQ